jgi:hypothetical protein
VVRRALLYGVGIGTVLILVNHGHALLAAEVEPWRLLRMALSVAVPYVISTLTSVSALRRERAAPVPLTPPASRG